VVVMVGGDELKVIFWDENDMKRRYIWVGKCWRSISRECIAEKFDYRRDNARE